MIILPDTYYKGEVLIRGSNSEALTKAKLAKNIWLGGTQVVKTLTTDNINNYLYTLQGSPSYSTFGGGGAIWFNSDLDIAYMNSGVSCREISGECQGININYDTNTTETYCFVVNMTGPVYCTITYTKKSYGFYQTEMKLRISAGENYGEWLMNTTKMSFSVKYNGTAYVVTCGGHSVTSEPCREQCGRLELAGSSKTMIVGPYAGFTTLKGTVTTGMARY